MEMRLTYQSQQNSSELTNIINQHNSKADLVNSCIKNAISQEKQRVDDRIKQRKMKSLSARSRSDKSEL